MLFLSITNHFTVLLFPTQYWTLTGRQSTEDGGSTGGQKEGSESGSGAAGNDWTHKRTNGNRNNLVTIIYYLPQ